MSLYVPRLRVSLKDWCGWTGQSWDKVQNVVGRSFRVKAPHESIYTMAANAVLRLIKAYDVDPQSVGFLGFGTESSTDNATGAVIIKGMVNQGLAMGGLAPLSRQCEVPEFKQACLGGVYALKGALRYLSCDGRGRRAIVVCADIAEYERGSSGEQTQGAGAVAMLLESSPTLFEVDLFRSGSASDYRGVDFRKPMARHLVSGYAAQTDRMHDFPVFNGRYSTRCYLDQASRAFEAMLERTGQDGLQYLEEAAAVLFHRPYHHMPVQALAELFLRQRAKGSGFSELVEQAGADLGALQEELSAQPDLFALVRAQGVEVDPCPQISKMSRALRKSEAFVKLCAEKASLGSDRAKSLGNLYSASLPAWLGAAIEEALERDMKLQGRDLLTVGYGSGDAAEAIPIRPVEGWQEAAKKLGFAQALQEAVDLSRGQYEDLHDGRPVTLQLDPKAEFVVDRVGELAGPQMQDVGVEYYRYVP